MIRKICARVLYGILGWKKNVTVQHPEKCIICLAPHTSNRDFVIGQLYMRAEGMRINFMMKKEWFFFPLECNLQAYRRYTRMALQTHKHD